MNNKKPSYNELEKKLSQAEKLVAKLKASKAAPSKPKRSILKTDRNIDFSNAAEVIEAYRASEQNFKNSMDASPLGIRIVTEDGKLIYANQAILDICGYHSAEEMAAVPHSKLYTPESYQSYLERKRKRKLNEYVPPDYEISIRRPDGEVRNLQVYRREVIWGGEQQYMAMYEDITESKRAREALRESEAKFHNIVEHSNDGIVFIQNGIIQYCNSKMQEMGSYRENDLIGKPFTDFVATEHKQMVGEYYNQRIAGKEVPQRYELNLLAKDGSTVYTEVSASLISQKQEQVLIAIIRNITGRIRAQQILSDEAVRRRILIEQSRDGIVILDQDGRVYESNQRFADMLGYTMEEMKNLHVFNWEFQYPREQVVEMIRTVDEKGDHFETKHRRKDGTIYDVEISTNGAMFAGQKLVFCVCRDITERKQMEKTLEESEAKYRSIYENSNDAVLLTYPDGRILAANAAACKMFGRTEEEIIKGGRASIIDSSDPRLEQALDIRRKTSEYIGELTFLRADGTKFPGYISSKIFLDKDGKEKTSMIVHDITQRKQMEQALRESEEKFSKAFNNSPEMMIIVNFDEDRYIEVNDSFAKCLGYNREELIGHQVDEFNLWVYPEEKERMTRLIREQGKLRDEEFRFRTKKGQVRAWLCSADIINIGGIRCMLGTSTDITERREAQEALRESQEMFSKAFRASPVLNAITTLKEGKFVDVNDAYIQATGFSRDEIIGKDSLSLNSWVNTKDRDRMLRILKEKGRIDKEEFNFRMKSGEIRTWLFSAEPISFGGEECLLGVSIDITERKQTEQELKESQELFSTAFHNSPTLKAITTLKEGRIIEVNEVYCQVTGYSREELIGHTTIDTNLWVNVEDRNYFIEKLKNSRVTPAKDAQIRTKSGDIKTVNISMAKITVKNEPCLITIAVDITERKRAEEALVASEVRYRRLFESAKDGILILDAATGTIIDVNPFLLNLLDFTLEEIIGKELWEIGFFTDIAANKEAFLELQNQGYIRYEDLPLETKDGKKSDVEFVSNVYLVNNTKVVQCNIRDITERKRAAEALRNSEEFLDKIIENTPNALWVSDAKGTVIRMNQALRDLLLLKDEEVVGKYNVLHDKQVIAQGFLPLVKSVFEEGRTVDFRIDYFTAKEEQLTTAQSIHKVLEIIISAVKDKDGKVINAICQEKDITERQLAEQRIKNLNQTLRSIRNVNQLITREKDRNTLIQGVCDTLIESRSFYMTWIALLDNSRRLITHAQSGMPRDFSPMAKAIEQGNFPDCVKKALDKNKVIVIKDPENCTGCQMFEKSLNYGTMSVRLEYGGNIYGVLSTSLPKEILADADEISLFQEVANDIAFALDNIERQQELERLEQERLRAAKMESIGTLAGGIAHDFNNLLTGIMGNIGMVKSSLAPTDVIYEMLDEAEKAAIRSKDLTQQLLTFARGGKPIKKTVEIDKIVKEAATFALRGSNAKLELSLTDDLWTIEADEGQINQVINNLVINADEAMPGGGTLKIQAKNVTLKKSEIPPLPGGEYVRIDVADTGVGISSEHLQRIFEPYFTTKQRGSGLGLTTAYSIVRNHGGTIAADSVRNKGSTFYIYLPATKKTTKGGRKMTAKSSGQAGGKVLVMDDEEMIRKMLKNMLNLAGYLAEFSTDGNEALEKYQAARKIGDPFDVVIMDLTIPGGMGGKETIKKLLEIDPDAKAIVSSGYANDPIMSEYKKYGFKAVIAKPYSVKQLQETLGSVIVKKK